MIKSNDKKEKKRTNKNMNIQKFRGGPGAKTPHSPSRSPDSIPSQGTISHRPQLRPRAAK